MKPERIQSDDQLTHDSPLTSLVERFPEWGTSDDGAYLRRRWHTPDGRCAAALAAWLMSLAEATGADPLLSVRAHRLDARLRLRASDVDAQARWIRAIEGEADPVGAILTAGQTS